MVLGLLAMAHSKASADGTPREKLNINPVWRFTLGDPADASKADFDDRKWDTVSLPHSHELYAADLSNFLGEDFPKDNVSFAGRKVGWYRRTIDIRAPDLTGKVFLVFQGAMETTKLWVNGKPAGECLVGGYTSFHFDITSLLQPGKNMLALRVDNTMQKDIPPDGAKCDFALFGGLYRDVDLVFTGTTHVTFPWEGPKAGTRARGQDNVPCPMDFEHKKLSGNAALCIEHTGHTFNTFRGQDLYREYDLAQRHWEHTDAAYKKEDNSGLAVWAMYDYNTPHYGAPYFQAPHGVCDIFRIPKLSYYWYCAELGKEPITHLYPFKDDKVVIFSNAEKVRFSESIGGKDFKEVGVLEPDKGFALKHPPFHANVSKWTTCYKAEGLVNGKVVSSHIYHRQSEPAALKLSVDDTAITADGGDMTRVLLQLVDKNGSIIINNYDPVNFSIKGTGLLVGENPTQLMAGQCIILVRSSFEPGKMTISAEMPDMGGIGKVMVSLQTVPVAANAHVDMPKPTVKAPTGKTVMPTNLKKIQVNLPADDFGWFTIPAVDNAEPGQMVESKPMLVAGQRQTSKLTVQGCEYRIYSSAWSSAPTDITRGDALFFRMNANKEAGQTATAEVTIQGVKRSFAVKTK